MAKYMPIQWNKATIEIIPVESNYSGGDCCKGSCRTLTSVIEYESRTLDVIFNLSDGIQTIVAPPEEKDIGSLEERIPKKKIFRVDYDQIKEGCKFLGGVYTSYAEKLFFEKDGKAAPITTFKPKLRHKKGMPLLMSYGFPISSEPNVKVISPTSPQKGLYDGRLEFVSRLPITDDEISNEISWINGEIEERTEIKGLRGKYNFLKPSLRREFEKLRKKLFDEEGYITDDENILLTPEEFYFLLSLPPLHNLRWNWDDTPSC